MPYNKFAPFIRTAFRAHCQKLVHVYLTKSFSEIGA